MTTVANPICPYCGGFPHVGMCPRIKSVEFNPDGTIRRVELHPDPYIWIGSSTNTEGNQ